MTHEDGSQTMLRRDRHGMVTQVSVSGDPSDRTLREALRAEGLTPSQAGKAVRAATWREGKGEMIAHLPWISFLAAHGRPVRSRRTGHAGSR